MELEEKQLLRTEIAGMPVVLGQKSISYFVFIAVLKLVNHPNIIRMEGVYENKTHIFIVMEKLSGGELFERIGKAFQN